MGVKGEAKKTMHLDICQLKGVGPSGVPRVNVS